MFKFLFRAPLTLLGLFDEANRNRHFSATEKIQAFNNLATLFLQQRFKTTNLGPVKFNILKFKVFGYDYPALIFLFREIFLSEVYYFKSGNKIPIIIDGGANIGISSLYFKFLYPQAQIIAFEPNPESADLFRQNITNNNLQNITLLPIGLSEKAGDLTFYPGDNKGSLSASFTSHNSGRQLEIKTEQLSFYIKKYLPEMVKLDVEGAETGIVKELNNTDALIIPQHYLIEYHQPDKNQETAFTDFVQIFTNAGFIMERRKRKTALSNKDQLLYFYR
jgi:FkbM family methyltransferase